MASKGGTIGRAEGRKPPIPSFSTVKKPKDASKAADAAKNKEKEAEVKNDHSKEETKNEESKTGDNATKGESKPEPAEPPTRVNSTIHKPQNKTETTKTDTDKEVKKTVVRTKEVPSRYLVSKASPRPTTSTIDKKPPIPKAHTPTTTMRTKTPERNAKTPTKSQPATPRIQPNMGRTVSTTVPKRVTPTPTTPTAGKKKAAPAPPKTPEPRKTTDHTTLNFPTSPGETTSKQKEDSIQELNTKITELQTELKSLTLLRDSIYFQQYPSEESEPSDWDDLASGSIDGASENSSELGDERDEKYIDMVKRYRSTLSIQLLKNALTDARTEYDNLQTQHNKLLADMNKVKAASSDAVAVS